MSNEHAGYHSLTPEEMNKRFDEVNAEFESFIKELEEDEANENANCNLEGDDCVACGS